MSISSRRAAAAKLFTAAGPFTRAVQRRSIAAVEHSKIVHGKSCVCCAVPTQKRGYGTSAHGSGCACCSPPSGASSWRPRPASPPSSRPLTIATDGGSGESIACKAVVAFGVDDVRLTDIVVAPPKAGEVRLKVVANAICHTDLYTLEGSDPEGLFPSILGHEAGAIVESVGEGVTSVKPGDAVIPCYTPQCGEDDCIFCMSTKTNLCPKIRGTQGQGVMPDGTSRFKLAHDGTPLHHFMGCR